MIVGFKNHIVFGKLGPYNVVEEAIVEEVELERGHGLAILFCPLIQKRTALFVRHRFVVTVHLIQYQPIRGELT